MKILKTVFFITAIALFITIGFTTCKKPAKEGTMTVTFTPTFNNKALSFDSIYADQHGNYLYFSYLALFLSDFNLVKNDNSLVEIDSVIFFDYENQYDPGWTSFSVTVPTGSYKGITFNVGLDSAQNLTNPGNFPASNPLSPHINMFWDTSTTGLYWGHRFVDLEGASSTNSGFLPINTLEYHVGTDTCYRTNVVASGSPFSIGGGNNNFNLNLDIYKIFYSGPGFSFTNYPGTQSNPATPGDISVATQFSNQITQAFSYSQ